MEDLDTVLRAGGTSPADFTLHDANHSLRVAHRIEQLLTNAVRRNLSDYEMALLLLSAYGHDIGMTPERRKVRDHHRHLFGHDNSLSEEERQLYQTFLDEYPTGPITLPLGANPADLDLAEELTAYYVRDRHNHWSAEWLHENLHTSNFGSLPGVTDVLVRLCSSHHWDFKRLRQDDFDPFLTTGNQPQLVHLRFLACLLRLADILENDPERTPSVLLAHRGISEREKSLTFWRKDHSFTVDVRAQQLHFQARPPDAHVHKAAVELADWIDHELHGIASLGERMPANYLVGKKQITREWHLPAALTRDIRPADDCYEYIEGAFRPNTTRLLQLLSNEQLYGSPLVAVRELLQNAFDAVREKIARRRLDLPDENIADPKWEKHLGDQERVTLTLRPSSSGQWLLVCEDSGVGLNKALVTGHLLVSGNPRRHAILELERRCANAGFHLGRTGQFGIGVLSYFMLAEEVELTTTRSQLCGDNDSPGWRFTTRGVGSFGELRPLKKSPFSAAGSRLIWQLKPCQIPNPSSFVIDLIDYLKKTLVRIPCRFEFTTEGIPGGDHIWHRPTGWVKTEEDWLHEIKSSWTDPDEAFDIPSYLPPDERRELERSRKNYAENFSTGCKTLRCEMLEIEIPDNKGLARLVLPFFELENGRSLSVNYEQSGSEFPGLRRPFVTAWNGMYCPIPDLYYSSRDEIQTDDAGMAPTCAAIEMDLVACDGDQISIDRQSMTASDSTLEGWRTAFESIGTPWVDKTLDKDSFNYYHVLNKYEQNRMLTFKQGCGWYHATRRYSSRHESEIRAIAFPFVILSNNDYHLPFSIVGKGNKTLPVLDPIYTHKGFPRPTRLNILESSSVSGPGHPALYYDSEILQVPAEATTFPPEWNDVALVKFFDQKSIANSDNFLIRQLSPQHLGQINNWRPFISDWFPDLFDNATSENAAFALCQYGRTLLDSSASSQMQEYGNRHADRITNLWEMVAAAAGKPMQELKFFVWDGRDNEVLLTAKSYTLRKGWREVESLLPPIHDKKFLIFHRIPNIQ